MSPPTPFRAILFDFDGVIADSEILSANMVSAALTEAGLPTTCDEALDRYTGLNCNDTLAAIAAHWGERMPVNIADRLTRHSTAAFAAGIEPVPGAAAFIRCVAHLPLAIGSSSASAYIRGLLGKFDLAAPFGEHVYSGREHVTRGKPHPDIYLHAAAALGVDPRETVIIEDSPVGIGAARAAGATVIGLCAGSHCRPGHDALLHAAGAHQVAASYAALAAQLGLPLAA